MKGHEPVAITGLGMVSPVGLCVASSCAAFRAGVPGIAEVRGRLFDNESDDPVPALGGRVPLEWFEGGPVEDEYPGHEAFGLPLPPASHLYIEDGAARVTELAGIAAEEAWHDARLDRGANGPLGLYLGIAEGDDAAGMAEHLADRLRARFELQRADRLGRAAGLAALHRAARHVREGRVAAALVGGVDSLVRPEALTRLADAGHLRTDDNPQGVLPGEAAAFVVLEREPQPGVEVAGWLLGSEVADEPTVGTGDANEGVGLTRAIRGARAAAGGRPEHFPRVVCDLNGDRYRALEWMYALVRALQGLEPAPGGPANSDRWHPADCTGDTGAASGIVNVVWGLTAMRRGYAHTAESLVWGASDGPLRAAALLGAAG